MIVNIEEPETKIEFYSTDRFRVERKLGEGGFGAVYQVYDKKCEQQIALKTLHNKDAEAIYYLKQEFRALADVTHPNLASLFELLSEADQWFFTMELIEGVNFLEYVWHSPSQMQDSDSLMTTMQTPLLNGKNINSIISRPKFTRQNHQLDIERLRSSMRQLAEGIFALHEEKKLHRDLKPSNVMVTSTGQVKILDFGLVTEMSYYQNTEDFDDDVVGTPAYMSPEQILGKPLTATSDWYTMGIMFYQALTGSLPHSGTIKEIIKSKRHEAEPPKKLAPAIPDDLNDLCVDLIKRDPLARPGGLEILCRLNENLLSKARPNPMSGSLTINPATSITSAPFIGRQQHLKTLHQAYQDVRSGKSVTVYIHGSSGMGKSTLARQFLAELQQKSENALIFSSRCYQQESVPYKAFDNIIDSLSRYLKHLSERAQLPEISADISALVRVFPVLLQVTELEEAQHKNLQIRSTQELRRRAFMALRELLQTIKKQRCLVLFIDDLQWGDIDSAALLAELLRTPTPLPMLLLATYRSEETETSPLLRTLLPMGKHGDLGSIIQEIVVGEFSATEAQQLVTSLMGEQITTQITQTEAIIRESGGSPFFIGELTRYSLGGLDLNQLGTNLNSEKLATSLNSVIRHRVSQLPQPVRSLLEVVTVAGQPIKLKIAKQAAHFTSGEQAALLNLRAQHLIRIRETDDEDELETYHDRIRETIVDNLSAESLKNYHCRLADLLEQQGNADPEQLMKHFFKSDAMEKAVHYAMLAGGKASTALAFDQAVQCYRTALDIYNQNPAMATSIDQHSLRVKLADALTNAGRGLEAAQAYLTAIETTADSNEIEDLKRRAVEQYLVSGHIDEGVKLGEKMLQKYGLKIPATRKRALVSILLNRLKLRWRGLKHQTRLQEEIPQDELMRMDACWAITLGLSNVDTVRAYYFQSHNLLSSLSAGEPYRLSRALAFEAAFSASAGSSAERLVKDLIARSTRLAEQINSPHAIALTNFITGFSHFLVGRWRQAYEYDTAAEKMFREHCTGVRWELDGAHVNALHSLVFLGEWSKILQVLPGYIRDAVDHGDLYGETILRCRIAYMGYLIQDQPDKASRELQIVQDRWSHQEFYQQHFWVVLGQAEIALYRGDSEWAVNYLNQQTRILTNSLTLRTQLFRILWLNLKARCALTMAMVNNQHSLIAEAEKHAKQIAQEPVAYAGPLAQQILAAIAAHNGDKTCAIRFLQLAEQGFDKVEMSIQANAMRYQRGRLVGGIDGETLINVASSAMEKESVKNPEKIANMLAPIKF